MLMFRVFSGVMNGFVIFLPTCPRAGDTLEIQGKEFAVLRIRFYANENYIDLTVEECND